MCIDDLTSIIKEYHKHFGDDVMSEYFKTIIKINNNKQGVKDASSQKKVNNSSGRN